MTFFLNFNNCTDWFSNRNAFIIDPQKTSLGRIVWFEQGVDPRSPWQCHNVSRRARGMFDHFVPCDANNDGLVDWIFSRGNSTEFHGVYRIIQHRTKKQVPIFTPARKNDSPEVPFHRGQN